MTLSGHFEGSENTSREDRPRLFDVIWVLSTRGDPARDIDVIGKTWRGPIDRDATQRPQ